MIILRDNPKEAKYPFLFYIDLQPPLIVAYKEFRSEAEYDADENAELTALSAFESFSKCFAGNVYLVVAGQDLAPQGKLRTYKGALWGAQSLPRLTHRTFELAGQADYTRLGVLVDLHGFEYNSDDKFFLNYRFGCIIFSTLDIDSLLAYVKGWLGVKEEFSDEINYQAMANELLLLDSTAVLRYFCADNGKPELIAILSQEGFFQAQLATCLERMQIG